MLPLLPFLPELLPDDVPGDMLACLLSLPCVSLPLLVVVPAKVAEVVKLGSRDRFETTPELLTIRMAAALRST